VINVDVQLNNPNSILAFYRLLFRVRKDHLTVFQFGTFEPLLPPSADISATIRRGTEEALLVLVNFSEQTVPRVTELLSAPLQSLQSQYQHVEMLLANYDAAPYAGNKELDKERIVPAEMRPYEALVFRFY